MAAVSEIFDPEGDVPLALFVSRSRLGKRDETMGATAAKSRHRSPDNRSPLHRPLVLGLWERDDLWRTAPGLGLGGRWKRDEPDDAFSVCRALEGLFEANRKALTSAQYRRRAVACFVAQSLLNLDPFTRSSLSGRPRTRLPEATAWTRSPSRTPNAHEQSSRRSFARPDSGPRS